MVLLTTRITSNVSHSSSLHSSVVWQILYKVIRHHNWIIIMQMWNVQIPEILQQQRIENLTAPLFTNKLYENLYQPPMFEIEGNSSSLIVMLTLGITSNLPATVSFGSSCNILSESLPYEGITNSMHFTAPNISNVRPNQPIVLMDSEDNNIKLSFIDQSLRLNLVEAFLTVSVSDQTRFIARGEREPCVGWCLG